MRKNVKILGVVLSAVAVGSGVYAFGTGADAPQKVKEAFTKKFPAIKKVKWEKESDTEWEGEFKINGTEYSANFLEDGTWQETEHEIRKKSIPAKVKTTLETEFSGYKIEESELTEITEGSVYEFELEKDEEELEVTIDTKGKVVNKKTKSENEEEKD